MPLWSLPPRIRCCSAMTVDRVHSPDAHLPATLEDGADRIRIFATEHLDENLNACPQTVRAVCEADESSTLGARGDSDTLEVQHLAPVPDHVAGESPTESPSDRVVDRNLRREQHFAKLRLQRVGDEASIVTRARMKAES